MYAEVMTSARLTLDFYLSVSNITAEATLWGGDYSDAWFYADLRTNVLFVGKSLASMVVSGSALPGNSWWADWPATTFDVVGNVADLADVDNPFSDKINTAPRIMESLGSSTVSPAVTNMHYRATLDYGTPDRATAPDMGGVLLPEFNWLGFDMRTLGGQVSHVYLIFDWDFEYQ
jgi:hypothetical protein